MVNKYRKTPVEIEAIQWTGDNFEEICNFVNKELAISPTGTTIVIETLEGNMFADKADFIIKGVQGEFYPCKPDIFRSTYEKVE